MTSIKLKGREIPLSYSVYEMKLVQEEIAPLGKMLNLVTGKNPDDEKDTSWFGGAAHIEAVGKLIRIMGNAGLEEAGEDADLTDKKVMRAIKPADLLEVINTCLNVINEGMSSEIPEEKKTGPVDVTLEELKKKDEKED